MRDQIEKAQCAYLCCLSTVMGAQGKQHRASSLHFKLSVSQHLLAPSTKTGPCKRRQDTWSETLDPDSRASCMIKDFWCRGLWKSSLPLEPAFTTTSAACLSWDSLAENRVCSKFIGGGAGKLMKAEDVVCGGGWRCVKDEKWAANDRKWEANKAVPWGYWCSRMVASCCSILIPGFLWI